MVFEFNQIRPNLVFGRAQESHIVDVPHIPSVFLKHEVDWKEETLGEEIRGERPLRETVTVPGGRTVGAPLL